MTPRRNDDPETASYEDCRKEGFFSLKNIGIGGIVICLSWFVTLGVYKNKFDGFEKTALAQEDKNKAFWGQLGNLNQVTTRHEALIPVMQTDIRDIKENQRDMNKKIDQILLAVRQ